jgi:hypothetical protein
MSKDQYLFAAGDVIRWTPIRDIATLFNSKDEAKSFKTSRDIPGHIIPN